MRLHDKLSLFQNRIKIDTSYTIYKSHIVAQNYYSVHCFQKKCPYFIHDFVNIHNKYKFQIELDHTNQKTKNKRKHNSNAPYSFKTNRLQRQSIYRSH